MSLNTGASERVAAGVSFDWSRLPPVLETFDGIPPDVEEFYFRRQKSPRGLSRFKKLKRLWAQRVNQETIDEISALPALETLHVGTMTATSLEPLAQNLMLKRLILKGGTKIADLDWVLGLPPTLEVLFLEGFKRATDLGPIGRLGNLTALGFEGGMDTHVRIDSLEPLAALRKLRYLFLASSRVTDRSLAPLLGLGDLQGLTCSIHFPDGEFVALGRALPRLKCDWIRMIEEHGSLRQGMQVFTARMKGR